MKLPSAAAIVLSLCTTAFAQVATEHEAGDEFAIEQLKAISDAIKSCPEVSYPDDYGKDVVSAPINTVWNVIQSPSARSEKIGYIEYTVRSYYSANRLPDCKKRDSRCQSKREVARQVASNLQQIDGPVQVRYEFDLGKAGLEFTRAFGKHEDEDAAHWHAASLSGCEGDAVSSILKARPSQVPQGIWDLAMSGNPDAMLRVGSLYEDGNGKYHDYKDAMYWYQRAASLGNAEAGFYLGEMYLDGEGAPADYAKALYWLQKSADLSDADAQYSLGFVYYYGRGG